MQRIIFLVTILGLGWGCAQKVRTTFDKKADFTTYQTFCWLQGCEFTFTGPPYLKDQISISSIKETIIQEMEHKGYVLDSSNPDFLIDFHITVENKQSIVRRYDENYVELYAPLPEDELYYYMEGTIIIDIVDKKSGRMVWRSHVHSHLENRPNIPVDHAENSVVQALKDFPPEN